MARRKDVRAVQGRAGASGLIEAGEGEEEERGERISPYTHTHTHTHTALHFPPLPLISTSIIKPAVRAARIMKTCARMNQRHRNESWRNISGRRIGSTPHPALSHTPLHSRGREEKRGCLYVSPQCMHLTCPLPCLRIGEIMKETDISRPEGLRDVMA